MSEQTAGGTGDTYGFGIQPGSVRALNDGMVEIIGIAFILVL